MAGNYDLLVQSNILAENNTIPCSIITFSNLTQTSFAVFSDVSLINHIKEGNNLF